MRKNIRQVFITGLAVTIPIGLTLYVFFFLIGLMDNLLMVIPSRYHPDAVFGFHIPGLGAITTLLLILIIGLAAKSYIGNRIVAVGEAVFHRIPVIRSVYEGTKQVVDNMFINKSRSFKKVVLVEFPCRGSYALGLVTGEAMPKIEKKLGRTCSNVFVPTTPNPTSGYLLVIPDESLVDLDITVEEAFTFIISCGIVNRPYRRTDRNRFITP